MGNRSYFQRTVPENLGGLDFQERTEWSPDPAKTKEQSPAPHSHGGRRVPEHRPCGRRVRTYGRPAGRQAARSLPRPAPRRSAGRGPRLGRPAGEPRGGRSAPRRSAAQVPLPRPAPWRSVGRGPLPWLAGAELL
uniref:Uncharacterized protein n=1 Tax=Setaria viridis TaxID=4556 RepID=A0A4U6VN43_SETVI|nr:hypothetical protein SEVIR_2G025300v2 [Setaria viridis]